MNRHCTVRITKIIKVEITIESIKCVQLTKRIHLLLSRGINVPRDVITFLYRIENMGINYLIH
jgi:hypothetical protein